MEDQFDGLSMEDLIGAPLKAAAHANKTLSILQTNFLLDNCFQQEDSGDNAKYEPINIKLSVFEQNIITDDNGKQEINEESTSISLPLLTIIPINSLVVDEKDIDYDIEVTSSHGVESLKNQIKKNKIDCPSCKKGNIHFDIKDFSTGQSYSCDSLACMTAVILPIESRELASSAIEGFKRISSLEPK